MTSGNGALSPTGERHPGEIVFEDRVENRTWTERAAEVPPTMAWVEVDAQWMPVVRIEIGGAGDVKQIAKFGPDHELLETTTARAPRR